MPPCKEQQQQVAHKREGVALLAETGPMQQQFKIGVEQRTACRHRKAAMTAQIQIA